MSQFKEPLEVLEFVIEKWHSLGLEFDESLQDLVRNAYYKSNAFKFDDKVINRINQALLCCKPRQERPEWLAEVDAYFCAPAGKKFLLKGRDDIGLSGDMRFLFHFVYIDVIQLLAPIVLFDHIVNMKSFDERFILAVDIDFLTRLDAPRDVLEAQRLYSRILELPHSFQYYKNDKPFLSPQPYLAQMMFVVLMMRKTAKHSDVWDFQIECLKNCPDYLLDYPDILRDGYTCQPAERMAHYISDAHFREILYRRASQEYRRNLDNVREFEDKCEKAKKDLTTNSLPDKRVLDKRIAVEQIELADMLMEFDAYLEQNCPDVSKQLRPGVNDDQIDQLNQLFHPLKLPEDLVTLYKWHNGIKFGGFLFGEPEFFSIETALREYREAIEFGKEFGWCAAWFVFSYASRLYWLIPMSETRCVEAPLLNYFIEDGSVIEQHSSIKNMIKSYMEAYKSNVVSFNESSNYRELDFDQFETIRLKYSTNAYLDKTKTIYDVCGPSEWPAEWQKYYIDSEE